MSEYPRVAGDQNYIIPIANYPFVVNSPFVSTFDTVYKPAHYNTGEIEAIMYLEDNMPLEAFIGYLEGSVKKYLHRWRYKLHPNEDLEKAQWYLKRWIWKLNGKMLKDIKE